MKAVIFNIQRISFVDGPGIRTTVFLKGCNLRCAWCHNPESQEFSKQLLVYKDKCTDCGRCKEVCPYHFRECDACGKCVTTCLNDAREICGTEMSTEEVFEEIIKDRVFYESSGGGVTFSGGECMLQIDFLAEILRMCKENNIHTAVDTAGNVHWEHFLKIIPYTDLFLYDIKSMDTQKHKKYTGVGNKMILENLAKLLKQEATVWVRVSVVSGINDTIEENEDSWMLIHIEGQNPLIFHKGKLVEAPNWIEGKDLFIRMQKESIVPEISYEVVFSEQSVMDELQGVRTTFRINLGITILLAIIGIMILLWINYRPIYTMITEFDEEERDNINEFERMKRMFSSLTQEKHTSRKLLEKQQKELMNSRLLMLMKGRGNKLEEFTSGEDEGFTLNNKIALVGFMVQSGKNDAEYEELQFFIIDNIFSELVEKNHFYYTEDGCFIFYLFDLQPEGEESWRQEVIKKAEYLCSMLYDKWGISIFGAISEIGKDIGDIKHLYQNIMSAFDYQNMVVWPVQ